MLVIPGESFCSRLLLSGHKCDGVFGTVSNNLKKFFLLYRSSLSCSCEIAKQQLVYVYPNFVVFDRR